MIIIMTLKLIDIAGAAVAWWLEYAIYAAVCRGLKFQKSYWP